MSNIYISEPSTSGKVILHTSAGEIELELWSKEVPKACRNFVQLCMENYYDNTLFHRVVPDFIIQGGDPTGTGNGGDSIYGEPFKTEVHSRLRFNRRGLVAMAIQELNCNRSQFFFTLGPAPELDKKHTIFAKVVGQTLYNMLKLGEVELVGDRPKYPHKIIKTEIISNPFDDIVPRFILNKSSAKKEEFKKTKANGPKNFSLLSFGDEAEEDEEENAKLTENLRNKSKSAHDLLNDPRLSSVPVNINDSDGNSDSDVNCSELEKKKSEQLSSIRDKLSKSKTKDTDSEIVVKTEIEEELIEEPRMTKLEALRAEADRVKRDIIRASRSITLSSQTSNSQSDSQQKSFKMTGNDLLDDFHATQDRYKKQTAEKILPLKKDSKLSAVEESQDMLAKPSKHKSREKSMNREDQTLALLNKFQSKLHSVVVSDYREEKSESENNKEDEEVNVSGVGWLAHKLKFEEQHVAKRYDPSLPNPERYDITDPRHPINVRKRKSDHKKDKHSSKSTKVS